VSLLRAPSQQADREQQLFDPWAGGRTGASCILVFGIGVLVKFRACRDIY
jgi:hypothetical protein